MLADTQTEKSAIENNLYRTEPTTNNKLSYRRGTRDGDTACASKCRNESRDSDHAHLGGSQHYKANTSREI